MNLENELCRKVYDHHVVLKGEMSTSVLEICTKAGVSREIVAAIVATLNSSVDTSSNKLVTDFQRTFSKNK